MEYYSINKFSKLISRTPQTLRNWDKSGKLKPNHTGANGYRYYSHDQLKEVLGIADVPKKVVGYLPTNKKMIYKDKLTIWKSIYLHWVLNIR